MTAVLAAVLASLAAPAAADDRPALPPREERSKAAAAVSGIFGVEASRAKTPADLTRLAVSIRKASATEKDAAAKWAMLDFARSLAAQAGDAKLIGELIAELRDDCGAGPEAAVDTGERLARAGRGTPELVDLMLGFADTAAAADEYAAAERIAAGGLAMANQVRDPAAARYFAFAQKRAAELGKRHAAVRNDPDALARFALFEKQDVRGALPLAAKSKDAKLAAAAAADLKADGTADVVAAGDGWWSLAEAAPAGEKYALFLAAGAAYTRALPDLAGLEKAKYESRVRQVLEAVEAEESKSGLFLAFAGTWEFDDRDGVSREFTVHRSGRVTFEAGGERLYLARSGKDVVLKHKRELSRWAHNGDTLTLRLFTPDGTKPLGTVTAKRK